MSELELLVLDGLDLNPPAPSGLYALEALACPPPRKRYEWAQGADSDGSALVRDPRFENRELTASVRVLGATMNASLTGIAAITDKLEEAERQPDGLTLVWTPAGATQPLTFYVLSGEIEEMPITIESGWLAGWPLITLKLIAKPFGYGAWVVGPTASSSAPMLTLTVPSVPGDVAAEGRLVISDDASQARRYIDWGMEQRHYDPATSLLLDSDSLLTSGYAGTTGTRTGAYDPSESGPSVITGPVVSVPQRLCGTGELTHVGTFRVRARVYCNSLEARIRLVWKLGRGAEVANPITGPVLAGAFSEIDLGLVSLPLSTLGAHRWSAEIEAYNAIEEAVFSPTGPSVTVEVDHLTLMPVSEGYGRAQASYIPRTGKVGILDDFTGGAFGSALQARTVSYGTGTWTTQGSDTHDFFIYAGLLYRGNTGQDSSAAPQGRFATLGAVLTYQRVEVLVSLGGSQSRQGQGATGAASGVLARFVDTSNYLRLWFSAADVGPTSATGQLVLEKVINGVATVIQTKNLAGGALLTANWYLLSLIVQTDGRAIGSMAPQESPTNLVAETYASDTVLATGGTLAFGKAGLWDYNGAPDLSWRYYNDFRVDFTAPPLAPVVTEAGGSIEFGHDETLRLDPGATTWSRPPSAIGDRFLLEPAGVKDRSARIAVRAHREDVEVNQASSTGDALTATVHYRPRYLAVPR